VDLPEASAERPSRFMLCPLASLQCSNPLFLSDSLACSTAPLRDATWSRAAIFSKQSASLSPLQRFAQQSSEVVLVSVSCGEPDPYGTASITVDPPAGFAPEVTRGHHLLEQRARPVFRVAEAGVKNLHNVEADIESD